MSLTLSLRVELINRTPKPRWLVYVFPLAL
jgi:hypothetical protein